MGKEDTRDRKRSPSNSIRSAPRQGGLSVLEGFGRDKRNRWTLSGRAKRSNMPKSNSYRFLKTPSRMGYLRWVAHSKHPYPGVRVLKMDYATMLMKVGSQLSEALGYRG